MNTCSLTVTSAWSTGKQGDFYIPPALGGVHLGGVGLELGLALGLAETLHRETPENALVGSTYALSLYQQGKTDEAVALFSTLKPDDLRQPQVALYYAIFLLAAGQKEKADEYLKLSADWPMLPEEKALLDRVKHASLNEHGRPPARSAPADKKP